MCPASRRADALNALTLVENIARLSTQGLFGFVFAALAELGKPHLTFFVNAVSTNIQFAACKTNHKLIAMGIGNAGHCAAGGNRSPGISFSR